MDVLDRWSIGDIRSEGLGVGVSNTLVDSADTGSGSHTDVDVAVVSPVRTPRVTYDVVVGRGRGDVSDDDDSVVSGSTARSSSNNSGRVRLEDGGAGVDRDSVGLDVDGSHDVSRASPASGRSSFNLSVSSVLSSNFTFSRVVLAGTLSSDVRVARLELKSVCLHVVPDVEGKTTFASIVMVRGRAIDRLLLGKLDETVSSNAVRRFGTGSSSEGVARSTASLVLDGVNATTVLGSPVDIGAIEVLLLNNVVSSDLLKRLLCHQVLEFGFSPVGEFVVSGGVSVLTVRSVNFVDEFIRLDEAGKTSNEFLTGCVVLVVPSDVLHEFEFNLFHLSGSGNADE